MELNMNCIKDHSLDDDDNFSNISRISFGLPRSMNSTYNSDSECSGPVSVRDMIQHYNNQFTKSDSHHSSQRSTYKLNTAKKYHHSSQHLLAATKSSYCGINNYGSNTSCKQFDDQTEDTENTCCKSCAACACCQNRSRKKPSTTKLLSSTSSSMVVVQPSENNKKQSNNFCMRNSVSGGCVRSCNANCNKINAKDTHILAVENCSKLYKEARASAGADISIDTTTATNSTKPPILNDLSDELDKKHTSNDGLFNNHNPQVVTEKQSNCVVSNDNVEEANICQQSPNETSYQSKTTIAKTSSGVRIIIDIFFDQERLANAADIVGSRVETDIPQSHILAEFQQQTMAATTTDAVSNS